MPLSFHCRYAALTLRHAEAVYNTPIFSLRSHTLLRFHADYIMLAAYASPLMLLTMMPLLFATRRFATFSPPAAERCYAGRCRFAILRAAHYFFVIDCFISLLIR